MKVSALLGHSSIHTTFEYYCEVMDEQERIISFMNDSFVPEGGKELCLTWSYRIILTGMLRQCLKEMTVTNLLIVSSCSLWTARGIQGCIPNYKQRRKQKMQEKLR